MGDAETEHLKFTMDPRCSPQKVLAGHLCDQTNFDGNPRALCLLKTANACDNRALEKLEGFFSWSAGGAGDSTAAPLQAKRGEFGFRWISNPSRSTTFRFEPFLGQNIKPGLYS